MPTLGIHLLCPPWVYTSLVHRLVYTSLVHRLVYTSWYTLVGYTSWYTLVGYTTLVHPSLHHPGYTPPSHHPLLHPTTTPSAHSVLQRGAERALGSGWEIPLGERPLCSSES